MSEIVERVGRALAAQEGYQYDPLPYHERARAAIQAMREPDESMLAAGWSRAAELIEAHASSRHVAEETWAAVFDAALAP